jgi:hypothetical protein
MGEVKRSENLMVEAEGMKMQILLSLSRLMQYRLCYTPARMSTHRDTRMYVCKAKVKSKAIPVTGREGP